MVDLVVIEIRTRWRFGDFAQCKQDEAIERAEPCLRPLSDWKSPVSIQSAQHVLSVYLKMHLFRSVRYPLEGVI